MAGQLLMRGAIPSPRHRLAAAFPHTPEAPPPPNYIVKPKQLDIWGNDVYGNCVSAEEAFAKAAYSVMCGLAELFIPPDVLIAWCQKYRYLNGAMLTDVMDTMATDGITVNGVNYKDGPPSSIDWTNDTALQSAIVKGPVKIGVAANQLQACGAGNNQGWVGYGFVQDSDEDHCVSLCGYGTMGWLAQQFSITLPAGVDPNSPGYACFTWATIGLIDKSSMVNITGEAWLRNPTTVGQEPPAPTPTPTPTPTPPPPTPTPTPPVPPTPTPPVPPTPTPTPPVPPTPTPTPTPPVPGALTGGPGPVPGSITIYGFPVAADGPTPAPTPTPAPVPSPTTFPLAQIEEVISIIEAGTELQNIPTLIADMTVIINYAIGQFSADTPKAAAITGPAPLRVRFMGLKSVLLGAKAAKDNLTAIPWAQIVQIILTILQQIIGGG